MKIKFAYASVSAFLLNIGEARTREFACDVNCLYSLKNYRRRHPQVSRQKKITTISRSDFLNSLFRNCLLHLLFVKCVYGFFQSRIEIIPKINPFSIVSTNIVAPNLSVGKPLTDSQICHLSVSGVNHRSKAHKFFFGFLCHSY